MNTLGIKPLEGWAYVEPMAANFAIRKDPFGDDLATNGLPFLEKNSRYAEGRDKLAALGQAGLEIHVNLSSQVYGDIHPEGNIEEVAAYSNRVVAADVHLIGFEVGDVTLRGGQGPDLKFVEFSTLLSERARSDKAPKEVSPLHQLLQGGIPKYDDLNDIQKHLLAMQQVVNESAVRLDEATMSAAERRIVEFYDSIGRITMTDALTSVTLSNAGHVLYDMYGNESDLRGGRASLSVHYHRSDIVQKLDALAI